MNQSQIYPDSPISISRSEFEMALDHFTDQGIPVKKYRDQAWQDFAGWRVNYNSVLIDLSILTMAPLPTWSSDQTPEHPS